MENNELQLFYQDFTDSAPQDAEEMFNKLLIHIKQHMELLGSYTISLSIVSSEKIQEINRDYRNIDRPTDVISFAYQEEGNEDLPLIDLGEILICLDVAKKQSIEFNHSYKRELAFLFIHGTLHLLGYDHMEEKEAEEMFALQNDILNSFSYDYEREENRMINKEEIRNECIKAREKSYSPYSHFAVGAVIATKDGKFYHGANIENSAYSLCVCAERTAIFNSYLAGVKKEDIECLALIVNSPSIGSPCGSCRQVMSEMLLPETPVLLFTMEGLEKETSVAELLPFAFSKENL